MPQLTLRPATAADAPAIAALHTESWRDAYAAILDPAFLAGPIEADRLELWRRRMSAAEAHQLVQVAQDEAGEVVGFICAFHEPQGEWGSHVDNLHVSPKMRGLGVGEQLLRAAAALLASRGVDNGLHLWVFEDNRAGLRFYERLGGRVVGQTTSRMAAAPGRISLRVHWPKLKALADGAD